MLCMNINVVDNCTSCNACADVCPKHCIEMRVTDLGHKAAFASDGCVDCGACVKVCPQLTKPQLAQPCYAMASWNPVKEDREKSSSGGIATIISEQFIKNGGVVYGCKFEPPFSFRHVRCSTHKELQSLRGSKYVQSDMEGVYKQISADLKSGRKVLFIGIPCQVAGVSNYFKNRRENLYLIDLLCHGAASVDMLKKSLPQNVLTTKISNVLFRNNLLYQVSIWKNDVKVWERPAHREWFLKGFLKDLFSKESCLSCQYAQNRRTSDLTLGDYWGNIPAEAACDRRKGVNVCVINSDKGAVLMNMIDEITCHFDISVNEELVGNKQLNESAHKSMRRLIFRILFKICGYKIAETLSLMDVKIKII